MAFLAPIFLIALAAVPIVLWLARQRQRPITVDVPSVEIWARVAAAATHAASQPTRQRRSDWALRLKLLAIIAAAVAAGQLGLSRTAPRPRHVAIIIDRSFLATPVLQAELDWAREFLERLHPTDTVDVHWVPPLRAPMGATPAAVVAWIQSPEHSADKLATDGSNSTLAATALAAAETSTTNSAPGTGEVIVVALFVPTADGSIPTAASAALVAVPFSAPPEPIWTRAAVSSAGVWVEVARPNGGAGSSAHVLSVWPCGTDGRRISDKPWMQQPLQLVLHEHENEQGQGLVGRAWVPFASPAVMPLEIEITGTRPAVRGFAPWRRPVGLWITGAADEDAERMAAWLGVVLPSVTWHRLSDSSPTAPEVERSLEAVVVAARAELGADGAGPAQSPLSQATWRRIPTLIIGSPAAPANPFVAYDPWPNGAALSPHREIRRPDHPLLTGVAVGELEWRDPLWMRAADDVERFDVLVAGRTGDTSGAAAVPLVAVAQRQGRVGVIVQSFSPVTDWPKAGVAGAALVANAVSWLIGDSSLVSRSGDDWVAAEVGTPLPATPAASGFWPYGRSADASAGTSSADPTPRAAGMGEAELFRAGWWLAVAKSGPPRVFAALNPVVARPADVTAKFGSAVPTPELAARALPKGDRAEFEPLAGIGLAIAFMALAGLAMLRPRHAPTRAATWAASPR